MARASTFRSKTTKKILLPPHNQCFCRNAKHVCKTANKPILPLFHQKVCDKGSPDSLSTSPQPSPCHHSSRKGYVRYIPFPSASGNPSERCSKRHRHHLREGRPFRCYPCK